MNASHLSIQGSGSYLPGYEVTSESIDLRLGFKKGYTEKLTGLVKRNYADGERASSMGYKAAVKALQYASTTINEIDCIIAACGTMDQAIPCNAALIHQKLNPKKPIPAFDINMTCLSHLMALNMASGLFSTQQYKKILIVSSDIASVGLDWNEIHSAGIFGDGAAAIVLSQEKSKSGILASHFSTYSEAADYCQILGAGTNMPPSDHDEDYESLCHFRMKGKKLYRKAAQILPQFVDDLMDKAGVSFEDIDWVVPHQASALALSHMQKKLNIPDCKFINIYPDHGNQIAASIPTALDHLFRNKAIKRDDLILMLGTSAGLSIGGMVLRY